MGEDFERDMVGRWVDILGVLLGMEIGDKDAMIGGC